MPWTSRGQRIKKFLKTSIWRAIMAAGVIEAVSSDERSAEELVAAAVRALDEAMKSSFLKTALHAAIRFRRV